MRTSIVTITVTLAIVSILSPSELMSQDMPTPAAAAAGDPKQSSAQPANDPANSKSRTEARKATVTRMLERLSQGDVKAFTDGLSPNYVRHCQAMPPPLQEIRGREAMEQWLMANRATFPDYREQLESLVAEGDFVAWRSRGSGTQQGPLGPFPATGKKMDIVIIGIHRFEGDLIAETWTSWDNVAALTQLGLLPQK